MLRCNQRWPFPRCKASQLQGSSDNLNHDTLPMKGLSPTLVKPGGEKCLWDNRRSPVQCRGKQGTSLWPQPLRRMQTDQANSPVKTIMLPLQGASHLLNHDDLQAKELFLGMVKQGEENCLSDNRWSAVQCQGARRDPSLVLPAKKAASAAPAQEKPVSSVANAIKDAAAGMLSFTSCCCSPGGCSLS